MEKEKNNCVKIYQDGWTGHVHSNFQRVPVSDLADPECVGKQRSAFEKVTSSDTAEVYRYSITVQGQEYCLYLKKYPHRSVLDAAKLLFRPSRAKRAFDAGLMLEKHELHTPQMVAFLQKKGGGFCTEDILITHEMKNATALSAVLGSNATNRGTMTAKDKRAMLAELGNVIGTMHRAGISHGDLRSGNVFVTQELGKWQFIFIDNERTGKYPMLPFWLRRKNLIQLNIQRDNVSTTDRMRFLKAYRQSADISWEQSKRLARIISNMTSKRLKRRAKTRTGLSDSGEQLHWNFQTARLSNRSGIFLTDFAKADIAAQFLKKIEPLMDTGHILKDDVSTRVVQCEYNGWNIVIKRYNYQGLWHSLRHMIKGNRARKCWKFGHLLTNAGIPCAAPLGMVEERRFGVIRQSYIINAFVEGPMLYTVMTSSDYSDEQKQAVRKKAEAILYQLAEHQMTHSDMKSVNMLVREEQPVLIDLDSMQQHRLGPYFQLRYQKMLLKFKSRLYGK